MGCEICKEKPGLGFPEQISPQVLSELAGADDAAYAVKQQAGGSSSSMAFLKKVKLFQRLPEEQHRVLAEVSEPCSYFQGQVIIKQGDSGNEFYVIVKGKVSVTVDGRKVATLGSGDHVGEMALLRDEPRNATITADTHVEMYKITRAKFQEMGLPDKLEFPVRKAVGGAAERNLVTKPPTPKTAVDRKVITTALRTNQNLCSMVDLDDAKCNKMADVAWEEVVPAGKEVITQGSDEADYFYIVKEGSFEIFLSSSGGGKSAEDSCVEQVGTVPRGGSFGELALIYYTPRAATVKASEKSILWVIDRKKFKTITTKTADDFAKEYIKYIDGVEFFSALMPDEKLEVAKALQESNFSKGETIFEQGERGTAVYILYEGEVAILKDGKTVSKLRASPDSPDKFQIFGELALINSDPRAATVNVVSDVAKTMWMDKTSFDMLLGPIEDIKKRGKTGVSKVGQGEKNRKNADSSSRPRTQILRKDLKKLALLGCGGFGAVDLVQHMETKEPYALKSLSKGHVVKCGMQKSVMSEKSIQWMCDSDFIVKLYECFNEPQHLCFLLELALGGELYATYCKKGFHGSEKHARFYVSGTVYAFEHLHDKKIVFRDLKPENLLLTEKGRIKLTDMGLAKVVVGKTNTTCGTPDYFAPEIIGGAGHNHAVDWWTLGILTFELMTGHPPFESPAPAQIMSKIKKGIQKAQFPAKVKGPCEELVKDLCKSNPADRLPMRKGGVKNIKEHSWFKGFDWDAMFKLTLDPPYQPQVKSKTDAKNFSANAADMPPQIKYTDDGSGWDKDFATSS